MLGLTGLTVLAWHVGHSPVALTQTRAAHSPMALNQIRAAPPAMIEPFTIGSYEPGVSAYMAAGCLAYSFVRVMRSTGVFMKRTEAPSYRELNPFEADLQATNRAREKLKAFGRQQQTLALPTMEELKRACHIIGTQDGRSVYICAERTGPGCQESSDYSTHYGRPVYVCLNA